MWRLARRSIVRGALTRLDVHMSDLLGGRIGLGNSCAGGLRRLFLRRRALGAGEGLGEIHSV